jgi:hypothetical protein
MIRLGVSIVTTLPLVISIITTPPVWLPSRSPGIVLEKPARGKQIRRAVGVYKSVEIPCNTLHGEILRNCVTARSLKGDCLS